MDHLLDDERYLDAVGHLALDVRLQRRGELGDDLLALVGELEVLEQGGDDDLHLVQSWSTGKMR